MEATTAAMGLGMAGSEGDGVLLRVRPRTKSAQVQASEMRADVQADPTCSASQIAGTDEAT